MVEVLVQLRVGEEVWVVVAEIFACDHEKAAGSGGGIDHHLLRRRSHHLHHEPDDVARRAELAVGAGGGKLAQHVLVDVALGVAVVHGDAVDQVDGLGDKRLRDGEAGIAHVLRIGGAFAEGAQPGKDVIGKETVHCLRRGVLQALPAEVLVGRAFGVVALREDAPRHRPSEAGCLAFLQLLHLVKALEEEQIRDLLDNVYGVGDAARPEGVPDTIYLIANITCEHAVPLSHPGNANCTLPVPSDARFGSRECVRSLAICCICSGVSCRVAPESTLTEILPSSWHQIVGDCKTEASARPVPLDSYMAEDLLRWRRKSPYPMDDDWVFASPAKKGKQPCWPENLLKRYVKSVA